MTADRLARLRKILTKPPLSPDCEIPCVACLTGEEERFVLQSIPVLLNALRKADKLAQAVETHSNARIRAHGLEPWRTDEEWRRLKQMELEAWWRTRIKAQAYRAATK